MVDRRTIWDILSEIDNLSSNFTPEWRYNAENPDAGTALAIIWANMLHGSIERLNKAPENGKIALFNALDIQHRSSAPSGGLMVFSVEEPVIVPKNTMIAQEDDSDIVFQTTKDLSASPMRLTGVYSVDPPSNSCTADSQEFVSCFNQPNENTGEKPLLPLFDFSAQNRRVWSFFHPFMLNISPGGSLALEIDCGVDTESVADFLVGADAVWEYLCEDQWLPARVERRDARLRTEVPPCFAVRFSFTKTAPINAARLHKVLFHAENSRLSPDVVYSNTLQQTEASFLPFGERFTIYDQLCIACDEIFSKPGAQAEISFNMVMESFPIEGYPEPEIKLKPLMRAKDFEPPKEYIVSVSDVAYEYFNGNGWAALPVEGGKAARALFGLGKEGKYCIRFTVPHDMDSILVNAHQMKYVRIRIAGIDNAYKTRGAFHSPRIWNLKLKYHFARGVAPEKITCYQDLETVDCNLSHAPLPLVSKKFSQTAVYFAFDAPFTSGTIFWETLNSTLLDKSVVWEYYTKNGWTELNVNDGTRGFQKSGLFAYDARKKCENGAFFGRTAYWMRAVDREGYYNSPGAKRPLITNYWTNATDIVCMSGGLKGNLPANSVTQIVNPISGVRLAANPFPLTGGYDRESDKEAMLRYSRRFSHRDRAVTLSDYTYLAYEASPEVIKCRCFPHMDNSGQRATGDICVVIMQADHNSDGFDALRRKVFEYIMERCEAAQRYRNLHIVGPQFVFIDVTAYIIIEQQQAAMTAQEEVEAQIKGFIHPVTGGFWGVGWEIGTVPDAGQIAKALRPVAGVVLQKLDISYTLQEGRIPIDPTELRRYPFVLPSLGKITAHRGGWT